MIHDSVIPYLTVHIPAIRDKREAADVRGNTEYNSSLWLPDNNNDNTTTEKKINRDAVTNVNGEIISCPRNHQHYDGLFLSDILPLMRPGRIKIDAVPFPEGIFLPVKDKPDLTVDYDSKFFTVMR